MSRSLVTLFVLVHACIAASPLEDPKRPIAKNVALSPENTVAGFVLPEGFSANVFVAEPELVQPIAYTMDDRGRIWVLENTNYPNCPGEKKDRILILEDTDGDGVADHKTVFHDKMSFASGIALGYGGVWVGAPPNLYFMPREEDQDVFKGEPEIVLDGWGGQDTHETLNNFIWGPDGWLYGTQGVFTHSNVGKPGTPDPERVKMNAGIWRYHPKKQIFELYAEGGSNQWGVDFDDHGQAYFAACVIDHMWQGIQGARYTRQAGAPLNPFTYDQITNIADFNYEKRAYCGAMIYLGGQWPEKYRNTFFFGDIHMNTLRNERFVRNGSGSKSEKNGDFLVSKDAWYRGLSPQYGPDGSVFISDWYDRVPCHQQKEFTDRSNGRIYRISYGKTKPARVDLQEAASAELVACQLSPNDWSVRHARRILAERGPDKDVHVALKAILSNHPDETRKLRALWALHVTDGIDENVLLPQLSSKSEFLRAWAIQLACEDGNPSGATLAEFAEMAKDDPSPIVRRYLASAAGRLSQANRMGILKALAAHEEDAKDPNLPQLIWYAAEPLVANDYSAAKELLHASRISMLSRNIGRRLAEDGDAAGMATLIRELEKIASHEKAADVVAGMNLALKGKKNTQPPAGWTAFLTAISSSEHDRLQSELKKLAASFGGEEAIAEMRTSIFSSAAAPEEKREALESLIALDVPHLHGLLISLIQKPGPLRESALRGLADFPNAWNPANILMTYPDYTPGEKQAALTTLASNKESASELLQAVDRGTVPKSDLSAQLVRQMQAAGDDAVNQWIAENWGSVRKSSKEKQKQMAEFRKFLGEQAIQDANASNGRLIFSQRCAVCHTLHGEGAKIGPELPGNFKDTDYLLTNILDPNATIGKDYQQTNVTKSNGQSISGVIIEERKDSVSLKTLGGDVIIPRDVIKSMVTSDQSLMPEGLMIGLEEPQIRDLFLYLRQSQQVPLSLE